MSSNKLKICKRIRVVGIFLVVISLFLIAGGSYALWTFSHEGESNDIVSYSAEIEFLESDSNVINITDAFPLIDTVGKEQEETFDFQVKTKSKGDSLIKYDLSIERIGISCSTIAEPDVDNYYSCYDYELSDSDKQAIAEYTLEMHDFYGSTVDEVVAFLDVLASHDKNLIYNNLIALGNNEVEVKQEIEFLKFDGYEAGIVYWYQVDTGNSVGAQAVFNQNNEIYNNLLYEDEVKVYLTDFQGNVLVPPTFISDVASNGYVLYSDKNAHNVDTEEVIDKYKLRVWIDENVDPSYWPEDVDLIFNFRINVSAKEVEDAATLMTGSDFNDMLKSYKANVVSVDFFVNEDFDVDSSWLSFDVSTAGDGSVMAYLAQNSEDSTKYDMDIVTDAKKLYANSDSSYMFSYFSSLSTIDATKLNTSKVQSMMRMFDYTTNLTHAYAGTWDTSNVSSMTMMFYRASNLIYVDASNWSSLSLADTYSTMCMLGHTSLVSTVGEEGFISGDKWTIPYSTYSICYD